MEKQPLQFVLFTPVLFIQIHANIAVGVFVTVTNHILQSCSIREKSYIELEVDIETFHQATL